MIKIDDALIDRLEAAPSLTYVLFGEVATALCGGDEEAWQWEAAQGGRMIAGRPMQQWTRLSHLVDAEAWLDATLALAEKVLPTHTYAILYDALDALASEYHSTWRDMLPVNALLVLLRSLQAQGGGDAG